MRGLHGRSVTSEPCHSHLGAPHAEAAQEPSVKLDRRKIMKRYFLATAAVLSLSAGSALAAGPDATTTTVAPATPPVAAASAYYGYTSGYVFPNDGSPSGTQSMAHAVPQPGHGIFSEIYLYPPAEGSDSGGGPG
jgi:hypothetical protein